MKIKKILLTGDDGYNSIGTRLLVRLLKDKYDLAIAATRDQMSGVGGHLSFRSENKWGEDVVDGVPAMWVAGYPCDAIECSVGYFKKHFDLVISGMNLGLNIGGAVVSSGTYSAAVHSLNVGLAPHAIAISWHCPAEFWHVKHSGDEPIDSYLDYPGFTAAKVLALAIENNFWQADLLNINLPTEKADKIRFTKAFPDLTKIFSYPIPMDRKTGIYQYPRDGVRKTQKYNRSYDFESLLAGHISISLHTARNLDEKNYAKMKNSTFSL